MEVSVLALHSILPYSTCAPKNRKERLMVVFAFLLDTEGPHFIECYMCVIPQGQKDTTTDPIEVTYKVACIWRFLRSVFPNHQSGRISCFPKGNGVQLHCVFVLFFSSL